MRNNDDLGGFENLAKDSNKLAFCCAIQKLSPVGGPPCGSPGLPTSRPAHPCQRQVFGQDDIHPAPRACCRRTRAVEVRTEAAPARGTNPRKLWPPRPSPVY